MLLLYVDDMLVFYRQLEEAQMLKENLTIKYDMTDLGTANRFLGFEI